ncbi:hypothetical protein Tco_0463148 [Tanacetum coccineum]
MKKRKKHASPRTLSGSPPSQPPPPPPPAGASDALGTSGALGPSYLPPPPPPSSTDYLMNEDSIPEEQVQLFDDEDTGNDHLPNADMRKGWWKPLLEEERPATPELAWTIPSFNISNVENNWASALVSTYEPPAKNSLLAKIRDMTTFMNWYYSKVNKTVLIQADFEGYAYMVVKAFYPDVIYLQFQMEECHKMLTDQINWVNPEDDQVRIDVSQPLPLGGPPGHLTIQTKFFFNKDLEYLRYGNKGSRPALSISKMKAACYPDFGLELLVPEKMWIDERHASPSHRRAVRTHMRILSVVRIKAYSRYRYDYLSKIVLRRADFQEHKIAKKDFKNLYPNDFEDLNLLLLLGHLDHLSGSDKLFPVNNNERKIMRFNKIYNFSYGTLTRILKALDYRVKEFKIKRLNPGMNTRFLTQKDVTRSKEFMSAIKRRLKMRRIYQNLECFVGGRVRDIDYRLLQRTE